MSTATTIPVELIDHIFTFVDNSSLFQLCRCSRLFRLLAFPRLTLQHMSCAKIRLWIEQPGLVSHKPMDFEYSGYDKERSKLIFSTKQQQQQSFQSSESPVIDGLTVVSKDDNGNRRIHSVSYKNAAAVPVPVNTKQDERTSVTYPGSNDQEQQRTTYSCAWELEYDVVSEPTCTIVPKTFECDLDLLDPSVLDARINEAPATKQCNNAPAAYWRPSVLVE
ncbi:hypothetical protein BJV82DRAFT_576899 [Fennellomyces sp. T-0311]|nr:hypothetical protein BJV82DRAFT_576899 [Fennellomyces sp. T-0311]